MFFLFFALSKRLDQFTMFVSSCQHFFLKVFFFLFVMSCRFLKLSQFNIPLLSCQHFYFIFFIYFLQCILFTYESILPTMISLYFLRLGEFLLVSKYASLTEHLYIIRIRNLLLYNKKAFKNIKQT